MGPVLGKNKRGRKELPISPELEASIDDLHWNIGAIFDGLAAATKFRGWELEEDEAYKIARPAARILSRYPKAEEISHQISDPLALLGACAIVIYPRWLAFKFHIIQERLAQQQNRASAVQHPYARPTGEGSSSPSPGPDETVQATGKESNDPGTMNKVINGIASVQ